MDHTFSSQPLSYRIVYGFAGGRLHGSALQKELKKAGYREASSLENADIVIAHSAGYWLLTGLPKAKIILLVAPALPQINAHQTYRKAGANMWRIARDDKYLLRRMLWSLYSTGYLITQPRHNRKLARLVEAGDYTFRPPQAAQIVVITNQGDLWPRSRLLDQFLAEEPWAFISMTGSHEDIEKYPANYIAIINQYAKRLLAPTNTE